jgi:hypothetical protein
MNNSSYFHTEKQKGSVIVELAIVIPVLLYLFFAGFDLCRVMFYEYSLKDLSRELAVSSFECIFNDSFNSETCLESRLDQLQFISSGLFPQPQSAELSIKAYQLLLDTDERNEERRSACSSGMNLSQLKELQVTRSREKNTSRTFHSKYSYDEEIEFPKIGDLFSSSETEKYGELLCLNRTLIIAEAAFQYRSLFIFNLFYGTPAQEENSDLSKGNSNSETSGGIFTDRRLHVVTFL